MSPTSRTSGRPAAATCLLHLAVAVCIAAAVFLTHPAGASALSGYAGNQPPVNVQYPDSGNGAGGDGDGGVSLGGLMTIQAKSDHDGRAHHHRADGLRKIQHEVKRREAAALASAPALGASGTGAVVLLLVAAGVFAAAGLLRWQRGRPAGASPR